MNKDTIYREDAIKALYNEKRNLLAMDADRVSNGVQVSIKVIESLPSADRLQGEWTNVGILTVHCSNCKSEFHELEAMNYCPHCGARMKGADETYGV